MVIQSTKTKEKEVIYLLLQLYNFTIEEGKVISPRPGNKDCQEGFVIRYRNPKGTGYLGGFCDQDYYTKSFCWATVFSSKLNGVIEAIVKVPCLTEGNTVLSILEIVKETKGK